MKYIVIVLASVLCFFTAYYLMKIKLKAFIKVLVNFLCLLVFGFFIVLSGLEETTLLIYIILLTTTLFGIIARIIAPIILNLTGTFVAKITNQNYKWLTYNQLMEDEPSGNKMYFCVLTFLTFKVALYLLLILSSLGLI